MSYRPSGRSACGRRMPRPARAVRARGRRAPCTIATEVLIFAFEFLADDAAQVEQMLAFVRTDTSGCVDRMRRSGDRDRHVIGIIGEAQAPLERAIHRDHGALAALGKPMAAYDPSVEVGVWHEHPFVVSGGPAFAHRRGERTASSRASSRSRGTLTAADAHRDHDKLDSAPLPSIRAWPTSRAPDAPYGCPSAIAPPSTLSRSIRNAKPVAAVQDLNCECFVELPQVDFLDPHARALSSFGIAKTGPIPISSGSQPATAKPRKMPSGSMPCALRASHP